MMLFITFIFMMVMLLIARILAHGPLSKLPEGSIPISVLTAYVLAGIAWMVAVVLTLYAARAKTPIRVFSSLTILAMAFLEGGYMYGWVATLNRPLAQLLPFLVVPLSLMVGLVLPVARSTFDRFKDDS